VIRLPEVSLPGPTLASLQALQERVDGAGDYAARVAQAKVRWDAKPAPVFFTVKTALTEMCSGVRRCCYCEDSLADEVEHIKPKDLYPEATFRWTNYVYACGPCNGPKNNQFAVIGPAGERITVTRKRQAPVVPPTPGEPALINPREEDPEELLQLDLAGTFQFVPRPGLSGRQLERANYTYELLFRDRDDMAAARAAAYRDYLAHLRGYIKRRDEGAPAGELRRLRDDLLHRQHPSVWRAMQRQPNSRPELAQAFAEAPEAAEWR
jgi:uncharacterized protein (TIGR02646 family)